MIECNSSVDNMMRRAGLVGGGRAIFSLLSAALEASTCVRNDTTLGQCEFVLCQSKHGMVPCANIMNLCYESKVSEA